jgi:hypothetical protein
VTGHLAPVDDPGDAGHILDSEAAPEFPSSWPPKQWAAIARDRVGDIGTVMCVQRSSRDGFFAMTTVFVRRRGRWLEEFANGDIWALKPTDPRPHDGKPIAALTSVTALRSDDRSCPSRLPQVS